MIKQKAQVEAVMMTNTHWGGIKHISESLSFREDIQ